MARLHIHPVGLCLILFGLLVWVVALGGLAASTKYCSAHTQTQIATTPTANGTTTGAVACGDKYQLEWWSLWFEFLLLLVMLLTCFTSAFDRARSIYLAYLSMVSVLLTIMAGAFITNFFLATAEFSIKDYNQDASNAAAAGAVLLCIVNFALIIFVGHSVPTSALGSTTLQEFKYPCGNIGSPAPFAKGTALMLVYPELTPAFDSLQRAKLTAIFDRHFDWVFLLEKLEVTPDAFKETFSRAAALATNGGVLALVYMGHGKKSPTSATTASRHGDLHFHAGSRISSCDIDELLTGFTGTVLEVLVMCHGEGTAPDASNATVPEQPAETSGAPCAIMRVFTSFEGQGIYALEANNFIDALDSAINSFTTYQALHKELDRLALAQISGLTVQLSFGGRIEAQGPEPEQPVHTISGQMFGNAVPSSDKPRWRWPRWPSA